MRAMLVLILLFTLASRAVGQPADVAPLAFAGFSLSDAESAAVAASPDVLIAASRVRSADAALAAARAGIIPSLVAGYASNPQAGATPNSTVTQTLLDVGAQTTLASFTGYLPALYQAEALDNAARSDQATAERLERVRAATLYFGALAARAKDLALKEALDIALTQERAARKRFASGDVPRIDVIRAQVATAQAQAAYAGARAADDNAIETLRLETGFTGDLTATEAGVAPQVIAVRSPAEAVTAALEKRSEIASAKLDVSAANSAVGAARANALPALTVSAGYAHGLDTGQPVSGAAVNANIELPFNQSQSSKVGQAQAAVQEAQANLVAAQRLVAGEVGSSYRNLSAAMEAASAASAARRAAEEELKATQTGYRHGASSSLDVMLANSTYVDARVAELTALYGETLARTTLVLELGP
jgi:outer membrane protein TolC